MRKYRARAITATYCTCIISDRCSLLDERTAWKLDNLFVITNDRYHLVTNTSDMMFIMVLV